MKGAKPAIHASENAQQRLDKKIDVEKTRKTTPYLERTTSLEGYDDDENFIGRVAKIIDLESERVKRAQQKEAAPGVLKRSAKKDQLQ